jgi:hypothetical protein
VSAALFIASGLLVSVETELLEASPAGRGVGERVRATHDMYVLMCR